MTAAPAALGFCSTSVRCNELQELLLGMQGFPPLCWNQHASSWQLRWANPGQPLKGESRE